MADTIFVGHLGTAPLAAIGLAATLVFLATAFGRGLLGGIRITVAHAVGSGDRNRARALGWQGVWLSIGLGTFVALLCPWGAPAFQWMGATPEVTALASSYYVLRTLGAPLSFAWVALTGWFQARGDTRTPMVATVLANFLNVALDPLLIFGIGPLAPMGIEGAAIATVLGQAAGVVILAGVGSPELLTRCHGPRRDLLRSVFRVGLPRAVTATLDVASYTLFGALLVSSGDAHLAAHVITIRIIMISFLPGFAIGQASSVLVGQALGAGHPARARRAWRVATEQATVLMGACGVAFVAAPSALVSIFGAAPDVAAIATELLLIAAAIQLFDAVATVAYCSLDGAGDTRFTMGASVAAAWGVKLPLALVLVLVLDLGAHGAWLGLAGEIVFLAVIGVIRVRGSSWLSHEVSEQPDPVAAAAK